MYDFLETLDTKRWFKILMAPVWLVIELICYQNIWKKIVVPEFIDKDKLFAFFDNNEFQYIKGKFIKQDLIDDNEFLIGKSMDECKSIIKGEFVAQLSKLISEESIFDIQDYVTLLVNTEIKITKIDGEVYRNKVYTVSIQYCRDWYIMKAYQYFIWWFVSLSISASAIIGLLHLISKN